MTALRHLDLFSGIGGFALAARMVGGIETVGFCERDKWAQRVLNKHWPDAPICNDIHNLKGNEYGTIDIITGGYPCQPFSLAGDRKGANDDRHLWPEVFRIIQQARPRWMLCENVIGHFSMGLDQVLDDMEGIGYSCAPPIIIPACAVGQWQERERVWIIAHSSGQLMPIPEMVYPEAAHEQPGRTSDGSRLRVAQWEADQPSMVGVAHGIPHWVDRARGLGNAIVPQVAAEILRCIVAIETGTAHC